MIQFSVTRVTSAFPLLFLFTVARLQVTKLNNRSFVQNEQKRGNAMLSSAI